MFATLAARHLVTRWLPDIVNRINIAALSRITTSGPTHRKVTVHMAVFAAPDNSDTARGRWDPASVRLAH